MLINFSLHKHKPKKSYLALKNRLAAFLLLAVVLAAFPVYATNGMNLIGYGAVSSGMGGADLAVVDNSSAMNINPAGICGCGGPQLIIGASLLQPKLTHENGADSARGENKTFLMPLIAYVAPLKDRFAFGIGAFSQGGMGVEYDALTTPFMTTDQVYSNLNYLKITPSFAWQSPDYRLKIGAGLNFGRAELEVKYFPNTFSAGQFDGFRADELEAFGYSFHLGFQYHFDRLVIGGSWISKTDLKFNSGDLTFASAPNVLEEAHLTGFNWPQQAGLGLKYSVSPTFSVAIDIDWIEWSQAVDKIVLKGDDRSVLFDMNWNDQWVLACGAEWEFAPDYTVRLGFNHGDSPVPEANGSSLFPAIIEDHVTFGLGYTSSHWKFDIAYVHGFEKSQMNPLFGTLERHSQQSLHTMFTWLF